MTIAIGMMTEEGIVIAADSQEGSGYPGEIKTPVEKIFTRIKEGIGAVAITGAGRGGHIDAAAQYISDEFLTTPPDEMEQRFRLRLEDYYRKHIVPLYAYDKFGNPDIDLIIGADLGKRKLLIANTGTSIRRCYNNYVAVGAGARHASILLSRAFFWTLPIDRAVLLAAYAVFSAKEYVEGCGKHTDLYVLKNAECWRLGGYDCIALDSLFEQYSNIEAMLVHHLFGRTGGIDNDLEFLEIIRSKILEIIPKQFLQVESE